MTTNCAFNKAYNGPYVDPIDFHKCVKKLRQFFDAKGFIEVPTQSRLSILAACEDPKTIAVVDYANQVWPLPQTGQMWLEYELLSKPDIAPGFYCLTSSYRNEKNPIPGRHDLIFPLFEFESFGTMADLQKMETELLEFLGFVKKDSYPEGDYTEVAKEYKTETLEAEHETRMRQEHGPVFFLKNFPVHTSPFFNMRMEQDEKLGYVARKIDVILEGMETIGSAERADDPVVMRKMFETISNGEYAGLLYQKFGKERVEAELDAFLSHKFCKRFGGGIGVTRLLYVIFVRRAFVFDLWPLTLCFVTF